MGIVKGQREYQKLIAGERLTYRQAVLAHCFECNGASQVDCKGKRCPLYRFMPYKGKE